MELVLWLLVGALAVLGLFVLVGRMIGQFQFAERLAARIKQHRIDNASPTKAFNDPLLRSLIACPSCGTAGQFDVIGRKQCRCQKCGTTWDAA